MTRPARIVDAHVHLWDPARTDWYPYLSGRMQLDMGDTKGMARRFDLATYRAESAGWNVEKLVNVAAAVGPYSVDETIEFGERAEREGQPDALIGGLPPTETIAEAVEMIDRQLTVSRFRGVRPMGQWEGPLPPREVLEALDERDLVFEVLTRPDQLEAAAKGLAGFDELRVVVEHTGWPRSTTDEERALWERGMRALAGLGSNVFCKLSGLAMPLGEVSSKAFAPWLEPTIEWFGVDRCFFASNFPVDGMHGTFDELFSAYDEMTSGLDDDTRDRLFAANATRIYRL
jgi:L-fuconolactonase